MVHTGVGVAVGCGGAHSLGLTLCQAVLASQRNLLVVVCCVQLGGMRRGSHVGVEDRTNPERVVRDLPTQQVLFHTSMQQQLVPGAPRCHVGAGLYRRLSLHSRTVAGCVGRLHFGSVRCAVL